MHIVIFTHPDFLSSQSMPRFAAMIVEGMKQRGHTVEVWTAQPFFYLLLPMKRLKKWLGYLDQFLLFPIQLKSRLRDLPRETLFVFSDQALGPWVPLVAHRPHVIHVHDFMALRSALGEFPQNPTSCTGKHYQAMIRRGFGKGQNFISVSNNTRQDLHGFLPRTPSVSEVVYNGLNYPFRAMALEECITLLSESNLSLPENGFLLHVGGNQWYKNRNGVLEIYEAYVHRVTDPIPLWMIGAPPSTVMQEIADRCSTKGAVRFLVNLSNPQVCAAYSAARLLVFPSIAEGFGWPIAEAMACGCPVITTDEAPMTEVGGNAAVYIPRQPVQDSSAWAIHAAQVVERLLSRSADELQQQRERGFSQVAQFDANRALDAYERIYQQVVGSTPT